MEFRRHSRSRVDSIASQEYADLFLVVVDNASTDHTVSIVERHTAFPRMIIRNLANVGYAAGMNTGLRALPHCNYVVPMNADAVLHRTYVAEGVAILEDNPKCAVAAGPLLRPGTGRIDAGALALRTDMTLRPIDGLNLLRCFKVNGAAPVVRRRATKDPWIGSNCVFDEVFDTYHEDIDLALRLVRSGYYCQLSERMRGEHARSQSSAARFIDRTPRLRRNVLAGRHRIALRYMPLYFLPLTLVVLATQDLLLCVYSLLRRDPDLRQDVVAATRRIWNERAAIRHHRRLVGPLRTRELVFALRGTGRMSP